MTKNRANEVIRDFRDGMVTFCVQDVGALVREIERLRLEVADYKAAYGGAAVTKSKKS